MIVFTLSKNDMDSGIRQILKEKDWSRLSLKSHVYQQPVFILKDGRKVGLRPKHMMVKQVENSDYPYHALDPTTPWYEWICYCEICHQLDVQDQPNWNRFIRYRNYLKEVGVL